MTAFRIRRVNGRATLVSEQSATVDIVYMGELDPTGVVQASDETFWCDAGSGCGPGVALKRVSAAQIADYVIGRIPVMPGTGGTVTGITASGGIGAVPNPITGSGSISLTPTGVTPGVYTNSNITVGADGRISLAASGAGGAVSLAGDVTGASSSTTVAKLQNRNVSATAPLDGQMLAWSGSGQVWQPTPPGGSGLSGMTAGQIPIPNSATTINASGNLSGDVTTSGSLATTLANSGVTAGTYQGIQFDLKGRAISAANQNYLTSASAASTFLPLTGGTLASPGTLVINANTATPTPIVTPALLRLFGDGANASRLVIDSVAANASLILRRANGSAGTPLPVASGDILGQVLFTGYASGTYATPATWLIASASQAWDASNQGSYLTISSIAPNTVTPLDRMVIGRIGGVVVNGPGGTPPAGGILGDFGAGTLNVATQLYVNGSPVGGGGILDAPNDASYYGRHANSWSAVLPTIGGAITGTAPGSLIIQRAATLPAAAANATTTLWAAGAGGEVTTILADGIASHAALLLRRANGTGSTPVASGDILGHMAVRGYGATGYSASGNARLQFLALEPFTDTAQGTKIELQTTPTSSNALRTEVVVGPGLRVGSAPAPNAADGGMQLGDISAQRLQISGNTAVAPPIGTPSLVRLAGADAVPARLAIDSFGANASLTLRRAGGTATSPSPPLNNDVLGQVLFTGYAGGAYAAPATWLIAQAGQNWDVAHQGSYLTISSIAPNTTAPVDRMVIGRVGGVVVNADGSIPPAGGTLGDMGPGTLNAAAGLFVNGFPVATVNATVNPGTGPQIAQYPTGTGSVVGGVTMGGDATIANGGAVTLANTAAARTNIGLGAVATPTWSGAVLTAATASLTVNRNTAPLPPAISGTGLWVNFADAETVNAGLLMDSYSVPSNLVFRRASGTAAARLATGATDVIGGIASRGYDGINYSSTGTARILFQALEPFTSGAQGTAVLIDTNSAGAASRLTRMVIGPGIQIFNAVGSPPAGGDMGAGTLNVATNLFVNGSVVGAGGGSGTPGPSNTYVQYNNSGAFGGSSGLTLGATAVTGLNVGLDATGDIYYRAAGGFTRLGIGTPGQLLNVTSGLLPAWATVALGTGTVSAGGAAGNIALYTAGAVVGPFVMSQDATISATGAVTLANTAGARNNIGLGTAAVPTFAAAVLSAATASLTVNRNAAALPPAIAGTGLWVNFADAETTNAGLLMDSYAVPSNLVFRQARGNGGGRLATGATDVIGGIASRGYDGSNYSSTGTARILFQALEPFTSGAQGTAVLFDTNAIGAASRLTRMQIGPGVQVFSAAGAPPTGGDLGAGTINVAQGVYVNNVLVGTGGGGAPGGSTNQAQYYLNSTTFGGSTGLTLSGTAVTSMNVVIGSDATGDLYYRGAGGALTRLGAGISGYLLQSAGPGVAPLWASVATGGGTVGSGGAAPQIAQYSATNTVGPVTMSGDATIAAGGALTIANSVITLAKMQDRTLSTLIGRGSTAGGVPQEITLGANLTMTGTVLAATGGASGLSGMTAGQIPIPNSATTINASGNLSGDVTTTNSLAVTLANTTTARTNIGLGTASAPTFSGATLSAGTALLTINRNAAALPPAIAGTALWANFADTDTVNAGLLMDSYAVPPNLVFRRANGTGAARAAVALNDVVGAIASRGAYDSANYSATGTARILFQALEAYTSTNQGTTVLIDTNPLLSTTRATRMQIGPGVQIFNATGAPAGGDLGAGTLNVATAIYIGGVAVGTGGGSGTVAAGGTSGQIALYTAGSTVSSFTMSGDATINATGVLTIGNNAITGPEITNGAVTYAKMQNTSVGAVLLGNPTGVAAAPSEITLGAGLTFSGTTLVASGGATGLSGMTTGQIPIAATATTITSSGNLSGDVTTSGSLVTALAATIPNAHTFSGKITHAASIATSAYLNLPPGVTPTSGQADGDIWTTAAGLFARIGGINVGPFGTGAGGGNVNAGAALTANQIVIGSGTTNIAALGSLGTTTTVLHGNAAGAPTFGAVVTADITDANVTYAKIQNISAISRLLGRGALAGTGPPVEITLGGNMTMTGTVLDAVGGLSLMTAGQVPIAATATTITSSIATTGTAGVTRIVSSTAAAKVANNLAMWDGNGNLLDAGAANTVGTVTSVGMTVPGAIFSVTPASFTTSGTFALTVAGTSGGIPYFNTTSTMASSGLLAANQLVIGGGAGTAPSSLAAGTATQVLHGGTPGTWGAVDLSTAQVTGVLQAAQEPAHIGEVTNTAGSLALTIAGNAVTYAKMQVMTANRLLGSGLSGTAVAEITLGSNLSFTGNQLNAATGGGGGVGTSVVNRVPYYDTTTTVAGNPTITSTTAGSLAVNRGGSTANVPAGLTAALQLMGGTTEIPAALVDAFAQSPQVILRSALGTATVPATTNNGTNLGAFIWRGFGATVYPAVATARIVGFATANFNDTVQPSKLQIETTEPAGTAMTTQATFGTGVLVGAPTAAATPAVGDLNAQRLLVQGGVVTALGAPSMSWIAGANPAGAIIFITDRAVTLASIRIAIVTPATGLTVTIQKNGSTTVGTASFDLGQTAAVRTLGGTVAGVTMVANDYLNVTTGGTWASSPSVANVTVFVS